MSTIINGRGIIKCEESSNEENKPEIETEDNELPEFSIEEYRRTILSNEEEWNNIYNPKRICIDAIETIMIRKKGKGSQKKLYTSMKDVSEGPYYDPYAKHVHNWKRRKFIPNLIGPQKQNAEFIQFSDLKPGLYCSICHAYNNKRTMTWRPEPDANIVVGTTIYKPGPQYSPEDFQKDVKYFPKIEENPVVVEEKYSGKWTNLMIKVLHSMNNNKIVYQISMYKSLFLWPWEMTPYQKFRYNNPDYKKNKIFVKSDLDKFQTNYVYIT